ncbi:unnamed protein product [marine sediment metagenome]|uniref:Uncharacterized protein n=1 Tax=marine sediment metagenome TaxID=412755 RepID=X1MP89_9ZZZZ
MHKEDVKIKLNEVLDKYDIDTSYFVDIISMYREKLELLYDSNRYNRLLKSIFSSNDENEFKSYVFESLFAYDFESNGHELIYEIKQLHHNKTTIDFCWKINDTKKVYFELRLISQRDKITQSIKSQLDDKKCFSIMQNGKDDQDETVRVQNLILGKCQDKNGNPVKFHEVQDGVYNFIAVNVSDIFLRVVDKEDCVLAMYGDKGVTECCQCDVFGLCQHLPQNATDSFKEYYNKFQHFRETIHGVLFVKNTNNIYNMRYIENNYEYYLISNNNLINNEDYNSINEKMGSFLNQWTE